MIQVRNKVGPDEYLKAVRELEAMPEVMFVNPVIGPYDFVAMVKTHTEINAIAEKLQNKPWVKDFEVLRIISTKGRRVSRNKSNRRNITAESSESES